MKKALLLLIPRFTTEHWACYRVAPPAPFGDSLMMLKPIMPARVVTETFHGTPDQVVRVRCFTWMGWEWRHRPQGEPISWRHYCQIHR